MTEPTNAEVMRRLDEVSRQLLSLAAEMREDRRMAADTYVRKDVYQPLHDAVKQRLTNLERENDDRDKAQDGFRRQITVAVIAAAIPAVLALLYAVVSLTNGGTA